jgi:murein DD-endopeptidase MepM/ murein hydrolase activator NlpD
VHQQRRPHAELHRGQKKYPEQRITLKNTQQVNPDPENLKRIDRELASRSRPTALQPEYPEQPAAGQTGQRAAVEQVRRAPLLQWRRAQSPRGLDFAVPAGTPIKTPANGKVILVGNYFNGNTVFVDHGQGFISMFCHMSKIDVKVGQQLARGEVVGKVGSTGRATGPHMHWNVSLNDARVDPAIFIGAFQP